MTMGSPFDPEKPGAVIETNLKAAKKREIYTGLKTATQNIKDLPANTQTGKLSRFDNIQV